MEKKRTKSEMEAHARRGGYLQLTMDDTGTGPGRHGRAAGDDSRKDPAVTLGVGESRLREAGERGRGILDVGEYSQGCSVVAPERDPSSYPCVHCRGGTDFDACRKIRGG